MTAIRSRVVQVVLALAIVGGSTPALAASFVGKWRAVAEVRNGVRRTVPKAVKMILRFSSSGDFKQTVQMGKRPPRPENGTWVLEAGKLVVRSGPSKNRRTTKRFSYRVSRGRLLLTTRYGKEKVVIQLRRAR